MYEHCFEDMLGYILVVKYDCPLLVKAKFQSKIKVERIAAQYTRSLANGHLTYATGNQF